MMLNVSFHPPPHPFDRNLPAHPISRETKKKILGMRGEEWGRIVVDGKRGQLRSMMHHEDD